MFADEMFGRTIGSPANDFQLQTGRFANITSIFDPDNALAGDDIDPLHSPFGYVGAEYDYKVCNPMDNGVILLVVLRLFNGACKAIVAPYNFINNDVIVTFYR